MGVGSIRLQTCNRSVVYDSLAGTQAAHDMRARFLDYGLIIMVGHVLQSLASGSPRVARRALKKGRLSAESPYGYQRAGNPLARDTTWAV